MEKTKHLIDSKLCSFLDILHELTILKFLLLLLYLLFKLFWNFIFVFFSVRIPIMLLSFFQQIIMYEFLSVFASLSQGSYSNSQLLHRSLERTPFSMISSKFWTTTVPFFGFLFVDAYGTALNCCLAWYDTIQMCLETSQTYGT